MTAGKMGILTTTAHVHTLHLWRLAVPTIRPIPRLPAQRLADLTMRHTPMLPAPRLVSTNRTCRKITWATYRRRLRARLRHLSRASEVDTHQHPRDLLSRDLQGHLCQDHLRRDLHLLVATTHQTM